MKSKLLKLFVLSSLALAAVVAQPASATVVTYGTGLHHWVLSCGPYPDGHSTAQYVGSSVCPYNIPDPAHCSCHMTTYDFPVNNPYPYFRVVSGPDSGDPGTVHVIIDSAKAGAIQCGVTVIPRPDDTGVCGAPFNIFPIDASQVDPIVRNAVDNFLPDLEKIDGVPVTSVIYSTTAKPQQ
jgi:hypothetical protein